MALSLVHGKQQSSVMGRGPIVDQNDVAFGLHVHEALPSLRRFTIHQCPKREVWLRNFAGTSV